jgi:hypothetical protein
MLPEGHGISAKYPGDSGIAEDPAVLFAEDFESGDLEAVGRRWDHVNNKDGKVFELRRDAPPASAGKHSLQMTATLGVNEGGHLYTRFRGVDTAFLRFYVKFAEDADYLSHFVILGGYNPPTTHPEGKAGLRPEGNARAHTGIEPMGDPGHYPPPGIWHFYSYWQDMRTYPDGKCWGNRQNPDHPVPAVRGAWQCVEIMMKMNSAPEEYDGELALWIDGKLEAHFVRGAPGGPWTGRGFHLLKSGGEPFEGFRWRNTSDLKINFLWLEHYVSGRSAQREGPEKPNPMNRASFDDVVVSTEYIGPIRG